MTEAATGTPAAATVTLNLRGKTSDSVLEIE